MDLANELKDLLDVWIEARGRANDRENGCGVLIDDVVHGCLCKLMYDLERRWVGIPVECKDEHYVDDDDDGNMRNAKVGDLGTAIYLGLPTDKNSAEQNQWQISWRSGAVGLYTERHFQVFCIQFPKKNDF